MAAAIRRALLPWLLLAGCAAGPIPPPASLGLDAFYTRYVDAKGIPIVASRRVDPKTLLAARDIVNGMLAHRPDLRAVLVHEGYRVAVMAEGESTLDLPEQAHWTRPARDDPRLTRCERIHYDERIGRLSDRQYWDQRARGMAGPLTSGAAEDLLGLKTSRYYGETIFVHEFSHDVLAATRVADPALYAAVARAYSEALATGLWKDEYASTSVDEYWAEGSQFWFDSNRLAVFGGRRILNHADLAAYDPALCAALARAYGASHHLAGDPFWMSPARIPPGPIPENTAEQC
ncbi:MAG: glycoside hydrolase [Tsuneonella sp.]